MLRSKQLGDAQPIGSFTVKYGEYCGTSSKRDPSCTLGEWRQLEYLQEQNSPLQWHRSVVAPSRGKELTLTNKPLLLQCPPTPWSSPLPGVSRAAPHTGSQTRSTTGLSCSESTSAGSERPIACRHIKAFSAREGSSVTPSGLQHHPGLPRVCGSFYFYHI